LYPRARVVTLVPLGFVAPLVQLPAAVFLGLWFVQQFLLGAFGLVAPQHEAGGIAWWAHIGGFAAGFVLVRLFRKPPRRPSPRVRVPSTPPNTEGSGNTYPPGILSPLNSA